MSAFMEIKFLIRDTRSLHGKNYVEIKTVAINIIDILSISKGEVSQFAEFFEYDRRGERSPVVLETGPYASITLTNRMSSRLLDLDVNPRNLFGSDRTSPTFGGSKLTADFQAIVDAGQSAPFGKGQTYSIVTPIEAFYAQPQRPEEKRNIESGTPQPEAV